MAGKSITELKVGFFVFAAAIVIMFVIFMLGGEKRLFPNYLKLYARFADISGLRIGAPVQLAGLKVGYVGDIKFPSDLSDKDITVALNIDKQYQDRIRLDSVATISTQGLLGDKFISISVGSPELPAYKSKALIHTKEAGSIFGLGKKASQMMDDIAAAARSIRHITESVEGKAGSGDLKKTFSALRSTMERVEKGPGLIHALFYDPQGEEVVADMGKMFKSASKIMKEADKGGQVGGLIANLRQSSADLKRVMSAVRRGEGTVGKLIMDPGLYDDLRNLFGGLSQRKMLRGVIRKTIEINEQSKQ